MQRVRIAQEAEVLLARVRIDFRSKRQGNSIILSRSDLTSKFCHAPGRGFHVHDLYYQLIPYLEARGEARRLRKEGKLERYAFP